MALFPGWLLIEVPLVGAAGMSVTSTPASTTNTSSVRRTPKPAGVGIYFQDDGKNIVVNHLIRGGSAERSGSIKAGDVIVSIDTRDVRGKSVSEMRNYIVGPEGSTVILGFVRPEGGEYTASLTRGSPEFIANMQSSDGSRLADERNFSSGQKLVLSAQAASNAAPPSQGPAVALPGGRNSAGGDSAQLLREVAMQAEREKLQARA